MPQRGIKAKPIRYPSVSVVVPVFNEEKTVLEIIRRIRAVPLEKEIILVDDGSQDQTWQVLQRLKPQRDLRLFRLPKNSGKGAALREGFRHAGREVIIIQDADLEYNPQEYLELLHPIAAGEADVVFGSRFVTAKERRVLFYWHSVVNVLLTTLCNMFSNLDF